MKEDTINTVLVIVCVVTNIPIALLMGKVMFGSWENYWSVFKTAAKPDILSWFSGNYRNDRIASFQISLHLLVCLAVGAGEYFLLAEVFGLG